MKFHYAVLALVFTSLAHAGSAIGVIGESPLTCKTSLIRGTQLEDVSTIVNRNQLYLHFGPEFPAGTYCSLPLAISGNTVVVGGLIQCGKDGQSAATSTAVSSTTRGNALVLSWNEDGVSTQLTLGMLNAWPGLPQRLLRTVDGVVSFPPDQPYTEISPVNCSIPPGF